MDYTDFFQIALNILIAILVALITSKLALRGFYKQEIWLRKEKLYSDIINGLGRIQLYYGKIFDEWVNIAETKMTKEQHKEFNKINRDLEALTIIPNILLKNEAYEILKALNESQNKRIGDEANGDIVSFFDRMYSEVNEANKKISSIAKEDLKINKKINFL